MGDIKARTLHRSGNARRDSNILASAAREFNRLGRKQEATQVAREALDIDSLNQDARNVILSADSYQWTGYVFIYPLSDRKLLHVVEKGSTYSIDIKTILGDGNIYHDLSLSGQKLGFGYLTRESSTLYSRRELGNGGLEDPICMENPFPFRIEANREDLTIDGLTKRVREIKRFQDGSRLLLQNYDSTDPGRFYSIYYLQKGEHVFRYSRMWGFFIEDGIPYSRSDSGHFWRERNPPSANPDDLVNVGFSEIGQGIPLPSVSRAFRENVNRVSDPDNLGAFFDACGRLFFAEVPISVLMGLEKFRDQRK